MPVAYSMKEYRAKHSSRLQQMQNFMRDSQLDDSYDTVPRAFKAGV